MHFVTKQYYPYGRVNHFAERYVPRPRYNIFNRLSLYGDHREFRPCNMDKNVYAAQMLARNGGLARFDKPQAIIGLRNSNPDELLDVSGPSIRIDGQKMKCEVQVPGLRGVACRVIVLRPAHYNGTKLPEDLRMIFREGLFLQDSTIAYELATALDFDGFLDDTGRMKAELLIPEVVVKEDDEEGPRILPLKYPPKDSRYVVAVNA